MMKEIKKLIAFDYLHSWQGFFLSLLIFSIAVVALPEIKLDFDVSVIMTIGTFLFGIIAAFFISERYSRYEKMRELVAKETSGIVSLHSLTRGISEEKAEELKGLVDDYFVRSLDYELYDYQKKVEKEFGLIEDFINLKISNIKTRKDEELYGELLSTANGLGDVRKEIGILGADRTEKIHWFVLISLSFSTIIPTVIFLQGSLIAKLFSALFASIIVLTLLVVRDLDNLRWRKESISYEPFEEAMDSLDLLRYYCNIDIKSGRTKLPVGIDYRIGYHQPGEKPDIRVVKAQENN